jgi:flagellar hook assembly protein FlgD
LADSLIDSLGDQVDIEFQGTVIGTWDGTNRQGVPVSNGVYHIKVDSVDPMGTVTSTTREAVVSRSIHRTRVKIYNDAGEVVRDLYEVLSDPGPAGLSGVTLTSAVIQPGGTGTIPSQLGVMLSNGTTVVWDGRADNGRVVTTGKYYVEVHTDDGQGGDQQITQSVMVEGHTGQAGAGTVRAVPNALTGANPQATFSSTSSGTTLKVRIYAVSGELVADLPAGPSGTVTWDATNKASGLYLAVVEVSDTLGLIAIHIVKLAVMF